MSNGRCERPPLNLGCRNRNRHSRRKNRRPYDRVEPSDNEQRTTNKDTIWGSQTIIAWHYGNDSRYFNPGRKVGGNKQTERPPPDNHQSGTRHQRTTTPQKRQENPPKLESRLGRIPKTVGPGSYQDGRFQVSRRRREKVKTGCSESFKSSNPTWSPSWKNSNGTGRDQKTNERKILQPTTNSMKRTLKYGNNSLDTEKNGRISWTKIHAWVRAKFDR